MRIARVGFKMRWTFTAMKPDHMTEGAWNMCSSQQGPFGDFGASGRQGQRLDLSKGTRCQKLIEQLKWWVRVGHIRDNRQESKPPGSRNRASSQKSGPCRKVVGTQKRMEQRMEIWHQWWPQLNIATLPQTNMEGFQKASANGAKSSKGVLEASMLVFGRVNLHRSKLHMPCATGFVERNQTNCLESKVKHTTRSLSTHDAFEPDVCLIHAMLGVDSAYFPATKCFRKSNGANDKFLMKWSNMDMLQKIHKQVSGEEDICTASAPRVTRSRRKDA